MAAALALAVGAGVATLGVGPAVDATAPDSVYPPRDLVVTVSSDTPDPGAPFDVTVSGCRDAEVIDFEFQGEDATVECVLVAGDGASLTGQATTTFDAPSESGAFVGTASLAVSGAAIGAFEIEVATPGAAGPLVDAEFIGQLQSGVNWLFILLLAIATLLGAIIVRRRLAVQ